MVPLYAKNITNGEFILGSKDHHGNCDVGVTLTNSDTGPITHGAQIDADDDAAQTHPQGRAMVRVWQVDQEGGLCLRPKR